MQPSLKKKCYRKVNFPELIWSQCMAGVERCGSTGQHPETGVTSTATQADSFWEATAGHLGHTDLIHFQRPGSLVNLCGLVPAILHLSTFLWSEHMSGSQTDSTQIVSEAAWQETPRPTCTHWYSNFQPTLPESNTGTPVCSIWISTVHCISSEIIL